MRGAEREGYGDGEPGVSTGEPDDSAAEVGSTGEAEVSSGEPGATDGSDETNGSARGHRTTTTGRGRRFRSTASDPSVAMFRRPKRPRFRRSSDVLMEPKQRGRLKAAAIAAEIATGRREDDEDAANRSVIIRLGRITLGTLVVLTGIIMLPAPGPGALVIAAGLAILSKDVAWADRALHFIREKVPGVPADGSIPRSTWLVMGLLTASGIAVGVFLKTGV